MPYLGIFGLDFSQTIVIFEISTLGYGSLTQTMNFGSAFSEGPDPALGQMMSAGCRSPAKTKIPGIVLFVSCFEE